MRFLYLHDSKNGYLYVIPLGIGPFRANMAKLWLDGRDDPFGKVPYVRSHLGVRISDSESEKP